MSVCSKHIHADPFCAACNTGVIDCHCGNKSTCSLCGGRGWYIGDGKPVLQRITCIGVVPQFCRDYLNGAIGLDRFKKEFMRAWVRQQHWQGMERILLTLAEHARGHRTEDEVRSRVKESIPL